MCSPKEETISHLLYGCTKSQSFRTNLQSFMREKCTDCKNLELTENCILFAVLQNVFTDKVLDLIVMLAKFYIYKCKGQETAPNLKVFLRILKDRYSVEIYSHITTDKLHDFDLQWLPYKGLIN